MDFILGILVAPWLFWTALAFCVIADFSVDRRDDYSGWAVVWLLVIAVISLAHYSGSDVALTLPQVIAGAVGYFLVGSLWSLWRYRSFIVESIAHIKQNVSPANVNDHLSRLKHETRASNYVGFIAYHMLAFPISIVTHVFGDVFRMMSTFVRRYMVGIFNTVHKKLFKDID